MLFNKIVWVILVGSTSSAKGASVAAASSAIVNDDLHFEELSQESESPELEPSLDRDTGSRRHREVKPIECHDQGRFAIPKECTQYYSCSRAGETASIRSCPSGKSFHHQMRKCMEMTPKECGQYMCKSKSQKFVEPSSKDKNAYLSCENMYPEVKKCPDGEKFNGTSMKCEGEPIRKRNPEEEPDDEPEEEEIDFDSPKQHRHVDEVEVAESPDPSE